MLSCEALEVLQNDMKELIKHSSLPFNKKYKLAPGAEIEIALEELIEPDTFQLTIVANGDPLIVKIDGHRKVPALLVGLTCEKVADYLIDRKFPQCNKMAHGGADELLSLYKCVREFKLAPAMPYSSIAKSQLREYRIFSLEEDSNHFRLELMTNHIYGESTKSIADIEYEALIPEQCYEMLRRMLGEWFRPETVKSVKFAMADLEQSQPVTQSGIQ